MPSSRVRQNASCTWMPIVETVSSPSYTLCSCRRPLDGVALPGVDCSFFRQHAAIRYWVGHCLPLFDSAPARFAPFEQHR